ncbi:hypothetical protein HWV62_31227 [Athelia sp. TMB]|nr:hypothetical protein HWV62_31227 [Athelia sp. TMB]
METTSTTLHLVSLCACAMCQCRDISDNVTVEVENRKTLRFNDAPIGRISPYFTGRDSELDTILHAIQTSNTDEPARFAIHGMPGLGKSQLALRFSKLVYTMGSYACIFWVSGTTVEKLSQGLVKILHLVGDESRDRPEQTVQLMAARRWLEMSTQNWLLVLDNATTDVVPFLREHLPRENSRGAMIITTRTSQVAEAISNTGDERRWVLELKPLSAEQSAQLLLRAAGLHVKGEGSNEESADSAEKLVRQIGCLPLAVEQAGAYMKQNHIPARELQTLYGEMLAAFSIPLRNLSQVSPDASSLLHVLAYFDPESISLDILVRGAELARERLAESLSSPVSALCRTTEIPPRKRRKLSIPDINHSVGSADASNGKPRPTPMLKAIVSLIRSKQSLREATNCLEQFSLVQPSFGDNPSLHLHDLIQLVILNQNIAADQAGEYHALAVTLLASGFETVKDPKMPHFWAECEMFVPHLTSLEKRRPAHMLPSREFMQMGQGIGIYFQSRGRYDEAELLLNRVLLQRENSARLGEEHLDTLTTVDTLADVYSDHGKYDKAEELYERALAGRKKQLGENHPDTLTTLNKLAYLRYLQGKDDQAKELFIQVLASREIQLGAEHLDTLKTVEYLAHVYSAQGMYDDAKRLYESVLEGRKKHLGSEHPYTLMTMSSLGDLYREQGKYDEAETLLARVLHNREAQFGVEHPDTLDVAHHLARLYLDQGEYGEAETLYARVLAGNEKQLGAAHPGTLVAVHNLATLREKQGRWEDAEKLYRRVIACEEQRFGFGHPDTRDTVDCLADFYEEQGRDEEARALRARFRKA